MTLPNSLTALFLNMKNIHLIYASTTGNTEAVMEKIAEVLNEAGFQTELHRSESTDISILNDNDMFILGTSTWGHGVINPFFDELLEAIGQADLTGKQAAFVGLGDKQYEPVYFNKGVEILKETFTKAGGTEIYQTLIIDGDPFAILDNKIPYWTQKLITALNDGNAS